MTTEILVVKEKHGTFYYDASTKEALNVSALKILKERWEEGYWYYHPDELYSAEDMRIIDLNTVVDVLKKTAESHNRLAERERAQYNSYVRWYERAKHAVDNDDPTEAYRLLSERSDHEYESVRVERIQNV